VTIHLSILLFFPLVLATLGAALPGRAAPYALLVGSLVSLVYAVLLLFDFEPGQGLQYVTDDAWIEQLGIRYTLAVDGLNLWLIALTALLFTAAALWICVRPPQWPPGTGDRIRLFAFHMGLAETAVLGAFMAQDLILFVLFFDLMLVPFYFLVGQFGGPDRVAATFKLVVYTLVGSLLMLAAAVAAGVLAGAGPDGGTSFSMAALARAPLDGAEQRWILAAFALAFLIKMPAFPFHGWMPDGYRNMPLPALAVFSGVLSKVAAYGFLRIALPIFPDAVGDFQLVILLIALASILYGSAQAFTQTNARLILGYSSMAQLGFITLGIFALGEAAGAQGALLQMVNHGLVVAPLFFIVALLAERTGSDDIRDMGGVAFRAPVLSTLFLIVALATLAMPGSANFAGEFLILLGLFNAKIVIAIIAFTGVAMASVYMLRAFIRAVHNRLGENVRSFDIALPDALVLVPLVLVIIAFAVYPQQALTDSQPSVQRVVAIAGGDTTLAQERAR
jgi:NADH-quinone oxidoreductase subunit M